jgi:hypothetical protein
MAGMVATYIRAKYYTSTPCKAIDDGISLCWLLLKNSFCWSFWKTWRWSVHYNTDIPTHGNADIPPPSQQPTYSLFASSSRTSLRGQA